MMRAAHKQREKSRTFADQGKPLGGREKDRENGEKHTTTVGKSTVIAS